MLFLMLHVCILAFLICGRIVSGLSLLIARYAVISD